MSSNESSAANFSFDELSETLYKRDFQIFEDLNGELDKINSEDYLKDHLLGNNLSRFAEFIECNNLFPNQNGSLCLYIEGSSLKMGSCREKICIQHFSSVPGRVCSRFIDFKFHKFHTDRILKDLDLSDIIYKNSHNVHFTYVLDSELPDVKSGGREQHISAQDSSAKRDFINNFCIMKMRIRGIKKLSSQHDFSTPCLRSLKLKILQKNLYTNWTDFSHVAVYRPRNGLGHVELITRAQLRESDMIVNKYGLTEGFYWNGYINHLIYLTHRGEEPCGDFALYESNLNWGKSGVFELNKVDSKAKISKITKKVGYYENKFHWTKKDLCVSSGASYVTEDNHIIFCTNGQFEYLSIKNLHKLFFHAFDEYTTAQVVKIEKVIWDMFSVACIIHPRYISFNSRVSNENIRKIMRCISEFEKINPCKDLQIINYRCPKRYNYNSVVSEFLNRMKGIKIGNQTPKLDLDFIDDEWVYNKSVDVQDEEKLDCLVNKLRKTDYEYDFKQSSFKQCYDVCVSKISENVKHFYGIRLHEIKVGDVIRALEYNKSETLDDPNLYSSELKEALENNYEPDSEHIDSVKRGENIMRAVERSVKDKHLAIARSRETANDKKRTRIDRKIARQSIKALESDLDKIKIAVTDVNNNILELMETKRSLRTGEAFTEELNRIKSVIAGITKDTGQYQDFALNTSYFLRLRKMRNRRDCFGDMESISKRKARKADLQNIDYKSLKIFCKYWDNLNFGINGKDQFYEMAREIGFKTSNYDISSAKNYKKFYYKILHTFNL